MHLLESYLESKLAGKQATANGPKIRPGPNLDFARAHRLPVRPCLRPDICLITDKSWRHFLNLEREDKLWWLASIEKQKCNRNSQAKHFILKWPWPSPSVWGSVCVWVRARAHRARATEGVVYLWNLSVGTSCYRRNIEGDTLIQTLSFETGHVYFLCGRLTFYVIQSHFSSSAHNVNSSMVLVSYLSSWAIFRILKSALGTCLLLIQTGPKFWHSQELKYASVYLWQR